MNSLVGYTGFVGSNLVKALNFDFLYNSKNIRDAFGTKPDLLVYSGIRAEKFLANNDPDKDYQHIQDAFHNICKIDPKKIVLISTVDVYKTPVDVDESSNIETEGLHPYGMNRYLLEQMVLKSGIKALIVRLPGLYGENIKKNFIYDLIHIVPSMLNEQKFLELMQKNIFIKDYYIRNENGFYKCKQLSKQEFSIVKQYFEHIGYNALNFTDSRGVFQFYNLFYLWNHIQIALNHDIRILNIVTEPMSVGELYKYIKKTDFINLLDRPVPKYNVRSMYSRFLSQNDEYVFNKDFMLKDINEFVSSRT
jgi:hypothetical protein